MGRTVAECRTTVPAYHFVSGRSLDDRGGGAVVCCVATAEDGMIDRGRGPRCHVDCFRAPSAGPDFDWIWPISSEHQRSISATAPIEASTLSLACPESVGASVRCGGLSDRAGLTIIGQTLALPRRRLSPPYDRRRARCAATAQFRSGSLSTAPRAAVSPPTTAAYPPSPTGQTCRLSKQPPLIRPFGAPSPRERGEGVASADTIAPPARLASRASCPSAHLAGPRGTVSAVSCRLDA